MTTKTTPVDPLEDLFHNAPLGDPLTDEEKRLLVDAHADIAAGRVHTQEEAEAVVAEMRRKQEAG